MAGFLVGDDTEVINGGVEGYSTSNVLMRMNSYTSLKPDLVVIYLGWNALYSDYRTVKTEYGLYFLRLINFMIYKLENYIKSDNATAIALYNKAKRVDPDDPELKFIDNYHPEFFKDVVRIVDEMQLNHSVVCIATLPGLFLTNDQPSELAIQVGHLPLWTNNPLLFAKWTEHYNELLRQTASKKGLTVIDLAQWGKYALQPRDKYFADSVHLYEEGQTMIGEYMAKVLHPIVKTMISTKR